jgi:dephospho-CoA kinase
MNGAMHLFGLTGGIASGKSTVAARFRERGVPVIDADQVAREVVEKGSPALAEIVARFGVEILASDGTLDRKALGARVFADAAARRDLNAITHPRIGARTMERAAALGQAGHSLVCYEAALLVENGLADAFRPLVVVAATPALQALRAAERDATTTAEAEQRIGAQMPLSEKVRVADFVVENDGSLRDLGDRADAVLDALTDKLGLARFPPHPRRTPVDSPP